VPRCDRRVSGDLLCPRPVTEHGPVAALWHRNSQTERVPDELPPDCTLLRIHVSGDFTSECYILGWRDLIARNPDVKVWAYTRSWRVPALLPALEALRALPNVQIFASMDKSTMEMPPEGWRRAWIDGDPRASRWYSHNEMDATGREVVHKLIRTERNRITEDCQRTYICPEETGHKANCEECRYCFDGERNDVTFLQH
jgi:hypothetical protein